MLLAYLDSEDWRIENELTELRNRIRFRKIEIVDVVELLLLMQRKDDFAEFSRNVIYLLHVKLWGVEMSQHVQVMAFRKRAKNRGYKDIHIRQTELSGLYWLSAREPVLGSRVEGKITIERMMKVCR